MSKHYRAPKNLETNASKLDWLIKEVTELNELMRGEGHEGVLKKVEKHDKGYNMVLGLLWVLTPATFTSLILGILGAVS